MRWTVAQVAVAHGFTPAGIIAKIKSGEITGAELAGSEWRITDSGYRDWVRRISYSAKAEAAP